jgi:hypothetical protein
MPSRRRVHVASPRLRRSRPRQRLIIRFRLSGL